MLKYTLFIITSFFLVKTAKCEKADTTIVYFGINEHGIHTVSTLDSAVFFRVILPPDSAETQYNIREYYKNGKIKLIGKSDPLYDKFKKGFISFTGDCIRYYLNGKKESITHYSKGNKEGTEYLFYPNGSIYCYRRHIKEGLTVAEKSLNWECYDTNGNMTCKDGNGEWLIYDREYKNILIRGNVINGDMDGDWHGYIPGNDSIKYIFKYNKGILVSRTGYDKTGNGYPFDFENESANYRGAINVFIDLLNSYLRVPKGPDGKKIPLDSVKISFIVEKNGQTSNLEVLGIVNQDLNRALAEALSKCENWRPSKFYGIPYRTKVTVPLKYLSKSFGLGRTFNIPYKEELL